VADRPTSSSTLEQPGVGRPFQGATTASNTRTRFNNLAGPIVEQAREIEQGDEAALVNKESPEQQLTKGVAARGLRNMAELTLSVSESRPCRRDDGRELLSQFQAA